LRFNASPIHFLTFKYHAKSLKHQPSYSKPNSNSEILGVVRWSDGQLTRLFLRGR
jgi:hypothetical protein